VEECADIEKKKNQISDSTNEVIKKASPHSLSLFLISTAVKFSKSIIFFSSFFSDFFRTHPQNFIFSFLLSSRIFIPPHELLLRKIESVPKNDESLVHLVLFVKEWTKVNKLTTFSVFRSAYSPKLVFK
jgi:hypothetical protein